MDALGSVRRDKWISTIRRESWLPTQNSKVCSDHILVSARLPHASHLVISCESGLGRFISFGWHRWNSDRAYLGKSCHFLIHYESTPVGLAAPLWCIMCVNSSNVRTIHQAAQNSTEIKSLSHSQTLSLITNSYTSWTLQQLSQVYQEKLQLQATWWNNHIKWWCINFL